jgi:2-polyprenyl-3-methyl-5-hydroxy-6-metoxy-1,4-benzoquinol methylase
MNKETQHQLLALNQEFYTTVAEPFDVTRLAPSAGKSELVRRLPLDEGTTLADIGCGNGRLAWLLAERGVHLNYLGVDANTQLLALAQAHTTDLHYVHCHFVQADLAQPDWFALLPKPPQHEDNGFDIVTCLATLQHLPGYDLRCTTMQRFAELVKPGGIVAISTWQFLTTPRFTARVVDWAAVGIDATQTEPGDALLPWHQGGYAVRYVHQIDMDEVKALAAAAGLTVETTYFADGKEGNLNLYALLRRPLE